MKVITTKKTLSYQKALAIQEKLVSWKKNNPNACDLLWLLSHYPVFTLGARKTSIQNLLEPATIETVQVSRGGDITYHDEGQITGYLLFTLPEHKRDLHLFLHWIEEQIIKTLQRFQISAYRINGKTGVFVAEKKICSIGIACRHWITYHGFSINLNSSLENYKRINPCGYSSNLMANLNQFCTISRPELIHALIEQFQMGIPF